MMAICSDRTQILGTDEHPKRLVEPTSFTLQFAGLHSQSPLIRLCGLLGIRSEFVCGLTKFCEGVVDALVCATRVRSVTV